MWLFELFPANSLAYLIWFWLTHILPEQQDSVRIFPFVSLPI